MEEFSLEELEIYRVCLTTSIENNIPYPEDDEPTEPIFKILFDATDGDIELQQTYDVDNMTEEDMINELKRLGMYSDLEIDLELE